MGPYPAELLARRDDTPDLCAVPAMAQLTFARPSDPASIVNAMREHQAMLDAIRDGLVNAVTAQAPSDPQERANHLKAFEYFADAAAVGTCLLSPDTLLPQPFENPDVVHLAEDLRIRQTKTLASGIDMIMTDLKDSVDADPTSITGNGRAIVFLYENPRTPELDEPGTACIKDAQALYSDNAFTVSSCRICNSSIASSSWARCSASSSS